MDLHLGDLTGTTLELGYSGAYQGATTVDVAADASAALTAGAAVAHKHVRARAQGVDARLTVTGEVAKTTSVDGVAAGSMSVVGEAEQNEEAAGTATASLVATGTAYQLQENTLELGSLTGATLELGYFATPAVPGTVDIAADASAALTTFVWPYALTDHGVPEPNSVMEGNQFATTGPVQLGLPTGGDASIAEIDFDLMDKEQGWLTDIEQYATTYQAGQVTYTFPYKIFETGETGSFERTLDVYVVVEVAGAAQGTGVGTAQPSVGRNTAGVATAVSAVAGDGIYTQDTGGAEQSALAVTAQASVSRETAGAAGSAFVALNLGIDVTSEGASFMQSTLSTAAQAHADKVTGGAGTAQLAVTGQPGQRVEVNAEGIAASVLTQTGEFVRTYSVASFQGSTLTATASATDTIVAEGSAQAAGTGQAAPEVTRGVTGQATAVVAAQGSASKGVSASSTPTAVLSTTGDAFIDRGFEVAADVVLELSTTGMPAYDAVVEGLAASTASAVGDPAVDRGVVGTGVAELFTNAVPGVDIEFTGVGAAALTAAGDAETAIVIQAGGSASAGATVAGTPAKTISFVGEGEAILSVVGQGATNQEGQGSVAMQLRTEADTVGGTPVVPRTLSADKVSIFPAMSCYTKVTPAMSGNGAIRPR